MYTSYFGLKDNPFSITPDPSYLYLSTHHQEALAHLLYGTDESGGFVQLTGEVGTGKTTLIRTLLEQRIDNLDVALCLNPRLTVNEFVASICDELHVEYPRGSSTLKPLLDALTTHLLSTHARGRRTVLIIDEAQNLSQDVLEQVRLLTNLETPRQKLLRIILVGQPELQRLLDRQDMRQLAQRITARYHLTPLSRKETAAYIIHRLSVAGSRKNLFTAGALRTAHRLSQGVPRLINIICDRALLGAYVRAVDRIDEKTLRRAAQEALHGPTVGKPDRFWNRVAWSLLLAVVITVTMSIPVLWKSEASFEPMQASVKKLLEALRPYSLRLAALSTTESEPISLAASPTPLDKLATADFSELNPAADAAKIRFESVEDPTKSELMPGESIRANSPTQTTELTQPSELTADLISRLSNPFKPDDAVARLLATWGEDSLELPAKSTCRHIQTLGLHCLHGHGDWEELRQFNHPVILTLKVADGVHKVLLRAIDGETATLEVDDIPMEMTLASLDPLWTGDYLLFWRLQTSTHLIGPGSGGKPVQWLRQRLAMVEGQPAETGPDQFDRALQEQVKRFQSVHQLRPDGVVGARTMVLLNSLAPAPNTPLLISPSASTVP